MPIPAPVKPSISRHRNLRCRLSSLSAPRITIFSASSGSGRCSTFASSQGARIQTSRSSSVVRITGIAFGWIGSTTGLCLILRQVGTQAYLIGIGIARNRLRARYSGDYLARRSSKPARLKRRCRKVYPYEDARSGRTPEGLILTLAVGAPASVQA